MNSPYSDSPTLITGDVCQPTTDRADAIVGADYTEIALLQLLDASTTHNTKRSYESDVCHFVAWGGSLSNKPSWVSTGCLSESLGAHKRRLTVLTDSPLSTKSSGDC